MQATLLTTYSGSTLMGQAVETCETATVQLPLIPFADHQVSASNSFLARRILTKLHSESVSEIQRYLSRVCRST